MALGPPAPTTAFVVVYNPLQVIIINKKKKQTIIFLTIVFI